MRIGLNLLYMIPGVVGGTETYAKGLLAGLIALNQDHEFILFLNKESNEIAQVDAHGFQSITCPVNAINRKSRYYFEQIKLRQYVQKYNIDLLHSLGYIAPLFLSCRNIVTIPDLNFKAFGNLLPFSRRLILNMFVKQSIAQSDKIITISEFSRREILCNYHVPREKVVVTYLAADYKSFAESEQSREKIFAQFGIYQPYLVAFSSTYPNKNIKRLIQAFLGAKKKYNFNHKLILIGHKFPVEVNELYGSTANDKENVIWTGYLDSRQVYEILKSADFLAFPSFYEGFGLPILEAMSAGIPVVCSNATSLPEIAGDAAIFFNPFSVEDMTEKIAMVALNQQLRLNLKQKGFTNLKRFSWKKTAAETIAVYENSK